jgi:hypothetical protein
LSAAKIPKAEPKFQKRSQNSGCTQTYTQPHFSLSAAKTQKPFWLRSKPYAVSVSGNILSSGANFF